MMTHTMLASALVGLMISIETAHAAEWPLDLPNVASPDDASADHSVRLNAILGDESQTFLGGRAINWNTMLAYGGDAAALNTLLAEILIVPGQELTVAFAGRTLGKPLDAVGDRPPSYVVSHDSRTFAVLVNVDAVSLDALRLPVIQPKEWVRTTPIVLEDCDTPAHVVAPDDNTTREENATIPINYPHVGSLMSQFSCYLPPGVSDREARLNDLIAAPSLKFLSGSERVGQFGLTTMTLDFETTTDAVNTLLAELASDATESFAVMFRADKQPGSVRLIQTGANLIFLIDAARPGIELGSLRLPTLHSGATPPSDAVTE